MAGTSRCITSSTRARDSGLTTYSRILHREQDGRGRRRENRRHSSRRSRHEQCRPFGRGAVEGLGEERAERAARHDDRAFRTEGPPLPIEIAEERGFEDGDLRAHSAAPDQNRFHRLRYPMVSDLFRPEPRHKADQKAAGHRHEDRPRPQIIPGRRHHLRPETVVVEQIGEVPDQPDERHCYERADDAPTTAAIGVMISSRASAVKSLSLVTVCGRERVGIEESFAGACCPSATEVMRQPSYEALI